MADNHLKRRKKTIRVFRISSESHSIRQEDWTSRGPDILWYGMPRVVKLIHPQGGTYTRCQVKVFFDDEDRDSAGYLPLPCRYSAAWIQLCYTIVYWLSTWKAWHAELQKKDAPVPQRLGRLCYNNSGTRLIKYLNIRRLIVEELLRHKMSKDDSDELDVFDEYLIRDRYDWLWTDIGDIPNEMQYVLGLDPVHPLNDAIFSGFLCLRFVSKGADGGASFSLE